jgi:hypothetical protein
VGKADMMRPYVEKTMKEVLGLDNLIVDSDGDIPVRWGSAQFYVRVLDGDTPLVRIFTPVVRNVKKTCKLLEMVNDMNCKNVMITVQWIDDQVLATTELRAESMDKDSLEFACNNMGAMADTWDDQVKAAFGGDTFYPDQGDTKEGDEKVDV